MIGILGGSFDPIHNGHLAMLDYALQNLPLTELRVIPCGQHAFGKNLQASSTHRLAMLELALQTYPRCKIDRYEIDKDSTSYTIDTLRHLRKQCDANTPLVFIIGMDAFASLSSWHEWQNLLDYCHLLTIPRGDAAPHFSKDLSHYLQTHQTKILDDLTNSPAGKIYLADTPIVAISSTSIRQQLATIHHSEDIPRSVLNYIQASGLYGVTR